MASRLYRFNGIRSEPLYHPPPLDGRYRSGPFGDSVLWVGRLEAWKRPALLLEALPHAPEARAVFVGRGPEEANLKKRADELGVAARVRFLSSVDDEALLSLYAEARIVAVTASGEDLGYVPLEAFLSGKPVITTEDAGRAARVRAQRGDGPRGRSPAEALGVALRLAWPGPTRSRPWGRRAARRAALLNWDEPIHRLLSAAGHRVTDSRDPLRRLAQERGRLLGELGVRPEDLRWQRLEAEAIASLSCRPSGFVCRRRFARAAGSRLRQRRGRAAQRCVAGVGEEPHAVAAGVLGGIERLVGPDEQLRPVLGAEAGRSATPAETVTRKARAWLANGSRSTERRTRSHTARAAREPDLREEHREFLAAVPAGADRFHGPPPGEFRRIGGWPGPRRRGPRLSLTLLKWSRSKSATDTAAPYRRCRAHSSDSRVSK